MSFPRTRSGADQKDATPPPNIAGLTLTRIATRAMTMLAELVPALRRMPKPMICAVNGAADINNGLTATELGLWRFEAMQVMQFAMRDASKRPAMAFVTFVHENEARS